MMFILVLLIIIIHVVKSWSNELSDDVGVALCTVTPSLLGPSPDTISLRKYSSPVYLPSGCHPYVSAYVYGYIRINSISTQSNGPQFPYNILLIFWLKH
jgi:hypothetical protein